MEDLLGAGSGTPLLPCPPPALSRSFSRTRPEPHPPPRPQGTDLKGKRVGSGWRRLQGQTWGLLGRAGPHGASEAVEGTGGGPFVKGSCLGVAWGGVPQGGALGTLQIRPVSRPQSLAAGGAGTEHFWGAAQDRTRCQQVGGAPQ